METATTENPAEVRNALRAEYEKITGKAPFKGWNIEDLRSRISVQRKATTMQGEGASPRTGEDRVTVVITASSHVFLPLEEWDDVAKVGVVPDEWKNVPGPLDSIEGMSDNEKMELAKRLDPRAVPRRARLDMPRSCAEFLSKRDQCEILAAA